MRWTRMLLLAGLVTTGWCEAQMPVAHQSGIVIPADIDGDAQGDFFVYDGRGLYSWRGTTTAPYVQPMTSVTTQFDRRVTRPIVVGRHLFVPMIGNFFQPVGGIEVFDIHTDGSLASAGVFRLDPLQPGGIVTSVRIAALPMDIHNDGVPDVIAVWSESPRATAETFRAATLSWNRIDSPITLQFTGGPVDSIQFAGLYPTRNLAQPTDELLMVVSRLPSTSLDRFGFVTLKVLPNDIRVMGQTWYTHAPSVRQGGWVDAWAPCAYGCFSPSPVLAAPVVTFFPGPTISFQADFVEPFVAPSGAWIDTSQRGFLLDDAVADYDGDGADEAVIVERQLGVLGDVVAVTDPNPYRASVPGVLAA